ncbi:MAG: hypothetical protein ACP5NX_02390 [Candidatus Bilamarchaeaceae archaeon]
MADKTKLIATRASGGMPVHFITGQDGVHKPRNPDEVRRGFDRFINDLCERTRPKPDAFASVLPSKEDIRRAALDTITSARFADVKSLDLQSITVSLHEMYKTDPNVLNDPKFRDALVKLVACGDVTLFTAIRRDILSNGLVTGFNHVAIANEAISKAQVPDLYVTLQRLGILL